MRRRVMKPDTSRWREDASYDYFDDLSVEGLAWECLRRDETYQDHYLALVTAGSDADPLPREVEQRWGLRFRRAAISLRRGTERPVVAGCRSGHRASRPTARVSSGRAQRVVRRHGCAAR
ncbi:transcriptional regulator domain-containing protein [Xanthobacter sp. YC-JY1]|uniref:transcriptional regulator domain-containing protein n=1 Tax=Xanthobacter sp. YC-JY1 TaxID=2419844 RepID=UPI00352DA80F